MIGVYAGSFDPFTNGHEDVLLQALPLFDRIIILVANNSKKKYMLSQEERLDSIFKYIWSKKNPELHIKTSVEILPEGISSVHFAKDTKASYLIRGMRTVQDFEFELQLAVGNSIIDHDIHTMAFVPSVQNQFTSSSMVREFIATNEDYTKLVPEGIAEFIKNRRS